ncbi:hypothetical protein Tco_1236827 [Tanacetum coccineum]
MAVVMLLWLIAKTGKDTKHAFFILQPDTYKRKGEASLRSFTKVQATTLVLCLLFLLLLYGKAFRNFPPISSCCILSEKNYLSLISSKPSSVSEPPQTEVKMLLDLLTLKVQFADQLWIGFKTEEGSDLEGSKLKGMHAFSILQPDTYKRKGKASLRILKEVQATTFILCLLFLLLRYGKARFFVVQVKLLLRPSSVSEPSQSEVKMLLYLLRMHAFFILQPDTYKRKGEASLGSFIKVQATTLVLCLLLLYEKDFEELDNDMLYHVREIFFKLHQGPGQNDLARTFSSFLVTEVDKRNLNPINKMRLIEQLRQ